MKLSIIIPVYNVEKYLKRCLNSVLNQSYKDLEIIIVNDCSPDNSQKIIDEYAQKDSRIKSLINKENKGLGGARNIGVKEASGEFLIFLDSDDYISDDNVIEKLVVIMKENNLDILDTPYRVINEISSGVTYSPKKFELFNEQVNSGVEYMNKVNILPIVVWNKMYRTDLIKKNKLNFKERKYEDICFTLELIFKADRVQNTDIIFYNYIVREGSIMTSKVNSASIEDAYSLCEDLEALYIESGFNPQIEKSFFYSFVALSNLLQSYDNKTHKLDVTRKLRHLHLKYRSNILSAVKLGLIQKISMWLNPKMTNLLLNVKKKL